MTTPDKTLLALGVVLFSALIVALFTSLKRGRNVAPLLPFFLLPIVMIAWPEIKSMKAGGVEIDKQGEINQAVASNFTRNPDDKDAVARYRAELTRLDDLKSAHPDRPLPAQTLSNLQATVKELNGHGNLRPESLVAISHAQLLLGETNAAQANLHRAVSADTNLVRSIDPRLKMLLRTHVH